MICSRRTLGWWPSSKASSVAHWKIHALLPNFTWNSVPRFEQACHMKSRILISGKSLNSWSKKGNWRRASQFLCDIKVWWQIEQKAFAKANHYSKRKAPRQSKWPIRICQGAKSSTLSLRHTFWLWMTARMNAMNARNRWGKLTWLWWRRRRAHSSGRMTCSA